MSAAGAGEQKRNVRDLFDALAVAYDNPATRFFPLCADRLVEFVQPQSGTRVLDVATGTGAVAVPLAQAIGPRGRVHAVDISPGMLEQAEANIRKTALANIDLHEMDAERLDFAADHFDAIVCSYGLFFLPDMSAALADWVRVLRPGGRLAFTSFEQTAFQPMLGHYTELLERHGAQLPHGPFGARRIESLDHCRQLLHAAGLVDTVVEVVQVGYHLRDQYDWWEIIETTAMRTLLQQLPAQRREAFRSEHLAFVADLRTDAGLWLDVQTRFALGVKPGA